MDCGLLCRSSDQYTAKAHDPSPADNGGLGVLISYHGIDSLAEPSKGNRSEPEKVRGRHKVSVYKAAREGAQSVPGGDRSMLPILILSSTPMQVLLLAPVYK